MFSAETIQRMLANLPPKRATRKIMCLKDGFQRPTKQVKNKVMCGKVICKKTVQAKSKDKKQKEENTRKKSLRRISKVLSSRILDTSASLVVKRKIKSAINSLSQKNKNIPEVEGKKSKKYPKKCSAEEKLAVTSELELLNNNAKKPKTEIGKNKSKKPVAKNGKMNLKNYFPVSKTRAVNNKKTLNSTTKNNEILKKSKLETFDNFVQVLGLRKPKLNTVNNQAEEKVETSLKRKLRSAVQSTVKKVKNVSKKKYVNDIYTDSVCTEIGPENKEDFDKMPLLEKIADAPEKYDIMNDLPVLTPAILNFEDKDPPALTEEVKCDATRLNIKDVKLDFETTCISPNMEEKEGITACRIINDPPKIIPYTKQKCKAKKTRGLNDCIAMLTNKLQQRTVDEIVCDISFPFKNQVSVPSEAACTNDNVCYEVLDLSRKLEEAPNQPVIEDSANSENNLTYTSSNNVIVNAENVANLGSFNDLTCNSVSRTKPALKKSQGKRSSSRRVGQLKEKKIPKNKKPESIEVCSSATNSWCEVGITGNGDGIQNGKDSEFTENPSDTITPKMQEDKYIECEEKPADIMMLQQDDDNRKETTVQDENESDTSDKTCTKSIKDSHVKLDVDISTTMCNDEGDESVVLENKSILNKTISSTSDSEDELPLSTLIHTLIRSDSAESDSKVLLKSCEESSETCFENVSRLDALNNIHSVEKSRVVTGEAVSGFLENIGDTFAYNNGETEGILSKTHTEINKYSNKNDIVAEEVVGIKESDGVVPVITSKTDEKSQHPCIAVEVVATVKMLRSKTKLIPCTEALDTETNLDEISVTSLPTGELKQNIDGDMTTRTAKETSDVNSSVDTCSKENVLKENSSEVEVEEKSVYQEKANVKQKEDMLQDSTNLRVTSKKKNKKKRLRKKIINDAKHNNAFEYMEAWNSDAQSSEWLFKSALRAQEQNNMIVPALLSKPVEPLKRVKSRPKANSKRKKKSVSSDSNIENKEFFCDICCKSFMRNDSLSKHFKTLVHIAKLSEIEAKQAAEHSISVIAEASPKREDINLCNMLQESEKYVDSKIANDVPLIPSAFPINSTNSSTLKLADIINDVLNKPVDDSSTKNGNFSNVIVNTPNNILDAKVKRCKSLGERKSFESDNIRSTNVMDFSDNFGSSTLDNNIFSKTASCADSLLEKQISLLENMIENRNTVNYIDDISISSDPSVLENNSTRNSPSELSSLSDSKEDYTKQESPSIKADVKAETNNFIKPVQYEEISEDSVVYINNFEEQKSRKTLNRDEELFLECCSLLKSGSEMSSYSKESNKMKNFHLKPAYEPDWMEQKSFSIQCQMNESSHFMSDTSRIPTPLGDNFTDDACCSNTVSFNLNNKTENHQLEKGDIVMFEDISEDKSLQENQAMAAEAEKSLFNFSFQFTETDEVSKCNEVDLKEVEEKQNITDKPPKEKESMVFPGAVINSLKTKFNALKKKGKHR